MDAERLREAAERLEAAGVGGAATVDDVRLLARHVLATVRPDDGEEATYEWARELISPGLLRRLYQGPKWIPTVRGLSLSASATRRQFRALCEALGIETKEVGS